MVGLLLLWLRLRPACRALRPRPPHCLLVVLVLVLVLVLRRVRCGLRRRRAAAAANAAGAHSGRAAQQPVPQVAGKELRGAGGRRARRRAALGAQHRHARAVHDPGLSARRHGGALLAATRRTGWRSGQGQPSANSSRGYVAIWQRVWWT